MGAADVVPGVSGGTMAFILGIYEELIRSIRSFDLTLLRLLAGFKIREAMERVNVWFLLALGCGILSAIFSLARLIAWLLAHHPVHIWSFFFGLVLASVATVTRSVARWSAALALGALAGAAGAYVLVGLVPLETPNQAWFLFLSGAVAICAMILPGISGSFILVILGKYHYLLEAVNQRDLNTLAIAAMGAGCGLILFSRLLNWLLKHHQPMTIAVLCGLMLGSLRKVWPWKAGGVNALPDQFGAEVVISIMLALAGAAAVLLLAHLAEGPDMERTHG